MVRRHWALGYHPMNFRHFPDSFYFPKIVNHPAAGEATPISHIYR